MPTEADLLAGIVQQPHELERWLILSDWLEDQGDPRAELARLRYLLHTEPSHGEVERRRARQLKLLGSGLSPVVPIRRDNPLGMPLALMLAGTFQMGSPASEADRSADEEQHTVELTEPYYLGVYPVTVGEFEKFVNAKSYKTETERGSGAYGYVGGEWKRDKKYSWQTPGFAQNARHPVVCVTWNDAQAMVSWLNETESQTGLVYSLPTEAQWEYACRAGTKTAYFWGNDANLLGEYAWFTSNSGNKTYPVETKKANPWGLWHLSGHVWEWCLDWYGNYPTESVKNPGMCVPGDSGGSRRVMRGGSWCSDSRCCRSAYRDCIVPGSGSTIRGFRLAVSFRSK